MTRPASPPDTAPGRVWAHVGQPFDAPDYDVVIIGAGRMGAACALYLRQLAPQLRLLLIEEGGLPNEEGATILAPGIFSTLGLQGAQQERAAWTRQQLEYHLGNVQWHPRPLVQLEREAGPGTHPTAEVLRDFPAALARLDPTEWPHARLDTAATYRPGSVALNAAQQAMKLGADLLLNTRAVPGPGRVRLERLSVTNTHQIVIHEVLERRCQATIIAAGALGPELAEQTLGHHNTHGRFYQQYPRLETPATDDAPVLRAGPLTLRPQHGGYTLIPSL